MEIVVCGRWEMLRISIVKVLAPNNTKLHRFNGKGKIRSHVKGTSCVMSTTTQASKYTCNIHLQPIGNTLHICKQHHQHHTRAPTPQKRETYIMALKQNPPMVLFLKKLAKLLGALSPGLPPTERISAKRNLLTNETELLVGTMGDLPPRSLA